MSNIRGLMLMVLLLLGNTVRAQKYAAQLFPLTESIAAGPSSFFLQHGNTNLLLGQANEILTFNGTNWSKLLSLPDGENITQLLMLRDTLWIGSESGRCWYHASQLREVLFQTRGSSRITSFEVHHDQLWVGTQAHGLFKWSAAEQTIQPIAFTQKWSTLSLQSFENQLWIGTNDGLHKLKPDSKKPNTKVQTIESIGITSLHAASEHLFIGSEDGQIRVWPSKQQLTVPFGSAIQKIQIFKRSTFVLDGRGQMWRQGPKQPEMQAMSIELNKRKIRVFDFHIDERGFLWLATSEGIASVHLAIENMETFNGLPIQAINEDQKGNLWLGTPKGLYKWPVNHKTPELIPGSQALNVLSLYEDIAGRLWIGTFGQGLFYFQNSKMTALSEASGIPNSNIFSMDADTSGTRLFLGTLGGVFFIDLARYPIKVNPLADHHADGPGTYYIYQVLVDRKNQLWIATDGLGVFCYHNDRFTRHNQHHKGKFRIALGLCEDPQGRIWVNSLDGGLLKISEHKVIQCSTPSTKPRSDMASIKANNEKLIIQYDQDLTLFNPLDEQEFSLANLAPQISTDGITNSAFFGNNLYFGKTGGITRIHPEFLPDTKAPEFSIRLTEPNVNLNQRYGHVQHSFSFQLHLLWPLNNQAIYKRYRLHPMQKEWVSTFQNEIRFQGLRPNKYELEVETSFYADFHDTSTQHYSFTIVPPFYQSWWFLILIAALLAGIAWLYAESIARRRKREATLKIEQVRAQYEQLRSQVSPHFLFNAFNTLLELIDEDPKKAATYVEQLSYLFRSVLTFKDADLITLEEELKLVTAYIFLQQQRFGDALRIEWRVATGQKNKLVIPLGLQLLIENAIKHNIISSQKPLLIEIQSDEYSLRVKNNLQLKAVMEPSTGFGLSSLKIRYEVMFKQNIIINQSANHFEVQLPLIDAS